MHPFRALWALSVFAWYSIAVTGRLEVGHQLSRMESVALESTSSRERLQQLESELTTLSREVSEGQGVLQRETEAQKSRLTAAVDELKAIQVNRPRDHRTACCNVTDLTGQARL
ncbi:MAG: hypothetical protein Ct9H300mP14_12030 [Gammaproteobacteria bacterium]|nr:MAG: hypothetical protein Ct9H300mP14_12030 [Gammaproteobacteria bacterium]